MARLTSEELAVINAAIEYYAHNDESADYHNVLMDTVKALIVSRQPKPVIPCGHVSPTGAMTCTLPVGHTPNVPIPGVRYHRGKSKNGHTRMWREWLR